MHRSRFVALILLGAVGLVGCDPSEPPPPYNYDLGDDQLSLLPRPGTMHAAHDSRIMSGSVQADIHKREDAGSAEVQAAASKPQAPKPASSMAEALGSIGDALLGRAPSSPGTIAKPESVDSGTAPEPQPAGEVSADDVTAIGELVDRYNQAAQTRDLESLAGLHVEDQKPAASTWYEINADLLGTLDALGNALEQKEAGAKSQIDALITGYLQRQFVLSAADLAPVGADAMQSGAATFRRVDSQWAVELASVPSADVLEGVQENVRAAETRLEELTDAVTEGSMDTATIVAEAEKALAGLSTP